MAVRASAWIGGAVGAASALAVAGCASVSDAGSYAIVLQDRFVYSTCKEIDAARVAHVAHEKDLVDLIEKAESGGIGGYLVGVTTYRSDLAQTRGFRKFLEQSAREKGCEAPKK